MDNTCIGFICLFATNVHMINILHCDDESHPFLLSLFDVDIPRHIIQFDRHKPIFLYIYKFNSVFEGHPYRGALLFVCVCVC